MSPILDSIGSVKGFGWGSFSLSTAFQSISTVTVGSGGASDVTFSSIPSTYTHLQVRVMSRDTRAVSGNSFGMRVGNGSIDTGNNYNTHMLRGDGSTISYGNAGTNYNNMDFPLEPGANISSSMFGVSIFDILDYTNTNKYKTVRCLFGYDANGSGYTGICSGLWMNTSAINTIRFAAGASASFVEYSKFALYGIKAAA
jgi:hypothetical protein